MAKLGQSEIASESFPLLAIQCWAGDTRCNRKAEEIQTSSFSPQRDLSLHLCNIYHFQLWVVQKERCAKLRVFRQTKALADGC